MLEFRIWRGGIREKSRIPALDFRKGDFGLFSDLLGRIPWDSPEKQQGPEKLVDI